MKVNSSQSVFIEKRLNLGFYTYSEGQIEKKTQGLSKHICKVHRNCPIIQRMTEYYIN